MHSRSALTGCRIPDKAEFLNPGGSVKDRASQGIVLDAVAQGKLKPSGIIFEGTLAVLDAWPWPKEPDSGEKAKRWRQEQFFFR